MSLDHHGAPVDLAETADGRIRTERGEIVIVVPLHGAVGGAGLLERIRIDQQVDAFADREPALGALLLDPFRSPHAFPELPHELESVQLRFPGHGVLLLARGGRFGARSCTGTDVLLPPCRQGSRLADAAILRRCERFKRQADTMARS